jgi:hypothetical protein
MGAIGLHDGKAENSEIHCDFSIKGSGVEKIIHAFFL